MHPVFEMLPHLISGTVTDHVVPVARRCEVNRRLHLIYSVLEDEGREDPERGWVMLLAAVGTWAQYCLEPEDDSDLEAGVAAEEMAEKIQADVKRVIRDYQLISKEDCPPWFRREMTESVEPLIDRLAREALAGDPVARDMIRDALKL